AKPGVEDLPRVIEEQSVGGGQRKRIAVIRHHVEAAGGQVGGTAPKPRVRRGMGVMEVPCVHARVAPHTLFVGANGASRYICCHLCRMRAGAHLVVAKKQTEEIWRFLVTRLIFTTEGRRARAKFPDPWKTGLTEAPLPPPPDSRLVRLVIGGDRDPALVADPRDPRRPVQTRERAGAGALTQRVSAFLGGLWPAGPREEDESPRDRRAVAHLDHAALRVPEGVPGHLDWGGKTFLALLREYPERRRQLRRRRQEPRLHALHKFRDWLREESASGNPFGGEPVPLTPGGEETEDDPADFVPAGQEASGWTVEGASEVPLAPRLEPDVNPRLLVAVDTANGGMTFHGSAFRVKCLQ
ncbi:unnamed protein product, partial [Prorocentrum cordatum]